MYWTHHLVTPVKLPTQISTQLITCLDDATKCEIITGNSKTRRYRLNRIQPLAGLTKQTLNIRQEAIGQVFAVTESYY